VDGVEALTLSTGLTYFGNRLCPFAHRAWWAMHEKGVADEARAARSGKRTFNATMAPHKPPA
jgi:glutathione S-transferase